MVPTTLTIMQPDGSKTERTIEMPAEPGYHTLKSALGEIIEGSPEHVAVLHHGKRADMFVDEIGHQKGLPRNEAATAIYRNNWLTQHPHEDPESIPFIVGPAVLFDRIVWS